MSDRKIIYLDDAIDAICKACQYDTDDYADCPDRAPSSLFCDYMNALRQLPSAQPEIIRCKDCKWGDWYTAIDGNEPVGDPSKMDDDDVVKMWERIRIINIINKLPSAQPEIPPYVAEIEAEYKKWVNVPYIRKPLAKALYEVWKKHDREDAEWIKN